MPSEYRRLSVDDKLRVQYHRGGDLTDEAHLMGSGAYVFGVSECRLGVVTAERRSDSAHAAGVPAG